MGQTDNAIAILHYGLHAIPGYTSIVAALETLEPIPEPEPEPIPEPTPELIYDEDMPESVRELLDMLLAAFAQEDMQILHFILDLEDLISYMQSVEKLWEEDL